MLLFSTLTLSSFTTKIIEVGVISDETSINNDLAMLGLTSSDYCILNDGIFDGVKNYYDEVYLIGIGENRQQEDITDIYFYLYNPCNYSSKSLNTNIDYYLLNLNINNSEFNFLYVEDPSNAEIYYGIDYNEYNNLTLIKYDENKNIWKFKFSYINHTNERKYELNNIQRGMTYSESNFPEYVSWLKDDFTNPFTATFKEREEDGQLISDFEYNSFIYITKDVLVPVMLKPEFKWNEVFDFIFSSDKEKIAFFYNFSSSKEIEQILELDVIFDTNFVRTYFGCINGVPGYNGGYVESKSNVKRTLYNEKHSYDWNSSHLEFETFQTPASERFTNEEFGYLEFNEEDKKQFTDYEHSVLIGLNDVYYHTVSMMGSASAKCYHYENINNLQVKRIKFETDGKIYNSYVADDPDNPIDPINPSQNNWFLEVLEWIKDHPLQFVLILVGLIVGIPIIVAILPYILSILGKLLVGIFKCIVWIITLPFRLIGKLINKIKERKRKKEDYKYLM